MNLTIEFLVVSELFDRYTIVVNAVTKQTSVYCEECDQWVNRYEGDQLSRHSVEDLFEMIVEDHEHQVIGEPVEFGDSIESFL
jgi:hypothetical protein